MPVIAKLEVENKPVDDDAVLPVADTKQALEVGELVVKIWVFAKSHTLDLLVAAKQHWRLTKRTTTKPRNFIIFEPN